MHRLLDNRNVLGLLFMLPTAVLLLMFLTYPLGLGVWLGFTDARIGRPGQWIGLENFQSLFDDSLARLSLRQTIRHCWCRIPIPTVWSWLTWRV